MGRKNKTARMPRVTIPSGTHLIYNPDPTTYDDVIVRYMGEQDDVSLKCFSPEGFEFWTHIAHLSRFGKSLRLA